MADSSEKSEQPTQKRRQNARKEGQFPSVRQFVAGVQFVAFVVMLGAWGPQWIAGTRQTTRLLIERAFAAPVTTTELVKLGADVTIRCFVPLLIMLAMLAALSLVVQLAVTGLGVSPGKLAPDFKRLNPVSRLKEMAGQNVSSLVKAAVLLPLFLGAVYAIARDNLEAIFALPLETLDNGIHQVLSSIMDLLWKGAGIFLALGVIELFREYRKHAKKLRMSKHEIKEESKESEGNPQIKATIRRLQREQARKRMMHEVPTATAVVVNPTHFAVALRYTPESMAAPLVVAKGKNYLALRIRQKALDHEVLLIENPPLAQALYKSVDVGQEIPPHLYRAVAEILAYIFKLMHGRVPGR
jgi:flagellar biosynthesis protein FlhB